MRKLGWFAVSATVVALVLSGVLLLAANLYVQSQGTQQRIRQTLADALRIPVTLDKTTVTPWEGLRLDGIVLHADSSGQGVATGQGNFLRVDSFRVRVALWPLIRDQQIVIESILLDHPRLTWVQTAEERWVWPEDPSAKRRRSNAVAAASQSDGVTPESPADPQSQSSGPSTEPGTPVEDPAVNESPKRRRQEGDPLPLVPKLRVRHGWLDFLTKRGKPLGRFEEMDMDAKVVDARHATGELRFRRASLRRSALHLANFQSAFNFDEAKGLVLDGGRAQFAGGTLLADYRLSTEQPSSPFRANCQLKDVDLSELLAEAGSHVQLLTGRLQGGVHLEGGSDDTIHRHAEGQLQLTNAELRDMPLLRLAGDLLRIDDLSHLRFRTAELNCRLDGDELHVTPLRLVSNDLQVVAQGTYTTATDQLDLHGRLTIDPAIGRQLPQFMESNFKACDAAQEPGCRYIDFDVSGSLNKPTTNLFDRVMAGPTSGLLQTLLAPRPKKPHPKGPRIEAQAPAAARLSRDGS